MSVNKSVLRKRFAEDWKKHYSVDFLVKNGFVRKQCFSCKKNFWTLDSNREVCSDSSCQGFTFIGKTTKKLSYVDTWKAIEKYFVKNNHTSIQRYPTVARWRNDLFFTNASIIDFQPFVVSGEIEPPANPLIVPQPSVRFSDIENVGVTGQHYSSFVMFGQHAFNSNKTGLFYWKNEALEHDFNYLTKVIGVNKNDLTFIEDVWAGGGTFGPSIEYAAGGVELGNCVFMQFKDLGNGNFEELKTKVIDMGAGLERLAWYTNGSPTSYEITFGPVVTKMKKVSGIKVDMKLFQNYAILAGSLDVDSDNLKQNKTELFSKLGVSDSEFFNMLRPLQAIYASADHLKTLLYTIGDGQMPSNGGGGYNLRILLRRVFGLNEEFDLRLDFGEILRGHANFLKDFDPILLQNVETVYDVVLEEEKKFKTTKEKGSKKIEIVLKKKGSLSEKDLMQLYESDGIPLEVMQAKAKDLNIKFNVPDNFYGMIAKKNEKDKEKEKKVIDVTGFKKTKTLFYEDVYLEKCNATVLEIIDNGLVLDKTVFYAESGGQESDTGLIDGVKVKFVKNVEGVFLHFVSKPEIFKRGQKVFCQIDFSRRKNLMRHHTGAHLLNAAARIVLGEHIWQTGAHKGSEKAHLDITHYKRITETELKEIEFLVNKFVLENHEIETVLFSRDEAEKQFGFRIYQGGYVPGKQIRIVNIKGIDVEACGGTHLKNSNEVGLFKILKREGIQDGVERILFVCGIPAIKHVQRIESLVLESAQKFSVSEKDLPKTAERFFSEWKEQNKKIEQLESLLLEIKIKVLKAKLVSEKKAVLKDYVNGLSSTSLNQLAKEVLKQRNDVLLVLGSGNNIFIMAGEKCRASAKKELEAILKQTKGNGGGSDKIARGKVENVEILKRLLF